MQSNDIFLIVDEAAQLIGFSHWRIRRWLSLARMTHYRAGSRVVVCCAELREFVKPKKVESQPA